MRWEAGEGVDEGAERVLEWGGPGFRWLRPLLPPEPASPSAERSGCTDLLSGVRYLHMTCPFVNLVPQLLASLHLCLPVPSTLQAPSRLSATSAACGHLLSRSPGSPTHLSLPCATLVWVAAPRWVPPPLLFPSGPCSLPLAAAATAFRPVGKPGSPAAAPWRSSRTCRVNSLLRALPPRLGETLQELSHLQPPLAWRFCIASHGSGERKKKCSNCLDVGIN